MPEEMSPEDYEPDTTPFPVEAFRAEAKAMLETNGGNPESIAILLRHSVHPFGYPLAYDYMQVCSELTGEPLTDDGLWERGATGELWVERAKDLRMLMQKWPGAKWKWDAFAHKWCVDGPTKGRAIGHSP